MSATFVLFTGIEILIALIIIIEILNKDSLIKFEDNIIRAVRSRLKKRLRRKKSAVSSCKNKNCDRHCINRAA